MFLDIIESALALVCPNDKKTRLRIRQLDLIEEKLTQAWFFCGLTELNQNLSDQY